MAKPSTFILISVLSLGASFPGLGFSKESLEVGPNLDRAKSPHTGAINETNLTLNSKIFPKACQSQTADFDQTLECAQKYFVIRGKPINPMIIKDLGAWLSDGGDQVVEINLLDSQNSNRYYYDNSEIQKNKKYFSVKTVSNSQENNSFSYSIEGVTDNGFYILKTAEWGGGGTGIFYNLLFVRIRQGVGFGEAKNGRILLNHKRILIEKLGEIPLGDRVKSIITVQGNSILIEAEQAIPPYEKSTKKIMLSLEKK